MTMFHAARIVPAFSQNNPDAFVYIVREKV